MSEVGDLKGVKVMVIDDSNTIRKSAEIFLVQAGCQVLVAEDGFDALAKIADNQPALFDRARGRMVGSDEYLTKPFTKESLIKTVAAHAGRAA